jgi:hypothetical protein
MIASKGCPIVQSVAEWGVRCPTMRFGQLISMLCGLADTTDGLEIEQITDRAILSIEQSPLDLDLALCEDGRDDLCDVRIREAILQELDTLVAFFGDCSVGQLTAKVATRADCSIYDIEDEVFLSAIKQLKQETEACASSSRVQHSSNDN